MGMVIDGAAATQAVDSSGEILDISGVDISELEEQHGVLNYEHRGDKADGASSNDVIAHITYAKKIFGETDCQNDRELSYWNRIQLPFIYIQAELFDDEGHPGAVAAAALIRYYHRRKMPVLMRYSIEGSTLERDPKNPNIIRRSIARRVAATLRPCNRSCFSGVISDPQTPEIDVNSSLEKLVRKEDPNRQILAFNEMEFSLEDNNLGVLQEALEVLREVSAINKAISAGVPSGAPGSLMAGEALQCEEVGGDLKKLKNQALAAYRDWRGQDESFKKFLKSRLPDADDDFIEHFVQVAEQCHVQKSQQLEARLAEAFGHKNEDDSRVGKLGEKLWKIAKDLRDENPLFSFKGGKVKPGTIQVISGLYEGNILHCVGADEEYYFVRSPNSGPTHLLRKIDEGKTYKVVSLPQSLPSKSELFLPAEPDLDVNQQALISGCLKVSKINVYQLRFCKAVPERYVNSGGQLVLLRPIEDEHYGFESIYYRLASDFFGLGKYVSTATVVKKEDESFWEATEIISGRHFEDDVELRAVVMAAGEGLQDKLSIMDWVLGSSHDCYNCLISDSVTPKLVDNRQIFQYGSVVASSFYGVVGLTLPMIPDAAQWLHGLDVKVLAEQMLSRGCSADVVKIAVRRLAEIKKKAEFNPDFRRVDIFVGE